MNRLILGCCLLTLSIPFNAIAAEKVFESIDDKGNVTFSDSVPADAVVAEPITIDPLPSPNADQLKADEAEVRSFEQSGEQSQDAVAQQRAAAQQRVEAAEANLAEAKQIREGDRKGMVGGGSRLTPEYLQRVQDAEQELIQAREALQKVGG